MEVKMRLDQKVALITGAAGEIGREIANACCQPEARLKLVFYKLDFASRRQASPASPAMPDGATVPIVWSTLIRLAEFSGKVSLNGEICQMCRRAS
jgi:hypothetical protein